VLIIAVRALEGDGVATAGRGLVIAALDAPLVSTSVGVSGVGGRADRAGWCSFFAELCVVAKLAAVSALADDQS
jgi:hypothetical protein